jgi:predicted P-loop ATPase
MLILYGPTVWAAKGPNPIRLGYWLQWKEAVPQSFIEMVTTLEVLADIPQAYIVRGTPIDTQFIPIRRRKKEPAFIRDEPRQWLCIDIDGFATDTSDLPRAVRRAKATLPLGLSSAECYYAVTGSTKRYSLHVHLWFWLERTYSSVEVKTALRNAPIDHSLYSPVQPHFTARPVIPDDTLVRRGIINGLPAKLGLVPEPDRIGAINALELACNHIAKARKGNRHGTLNRNAFHLARRIAEGAIERDPLESALSDAAIIAGLPRDRIGDEVTRAIDDGLESAQRAPWVGQLHRNKDDTVKATHANALIALSDAPEWLGTLGYDERNGLVIWLRNPPTTEIAFINAREGLPFLDEHSSIIVQWLARFGIYMTLDVALKQALYIARLNSYDPVVDSLREFDHDGTPRLDSFLTRYFGAEDNEYHHAIGRAWMISAVARAFEPGCKADYALIFEETQGTRKSLALDILALGYCRELKVSLDSKDASDALHNGGAWIVSLTELAAVKRTKDIEALKAFITAREDHYREAYARVTQTRKRSVVFAGTTNSETYLADETGNRRIWPVRCQGIADTNALQRDAEQLWAEAAIAYLNGERWWIEPDKEKQIIVPQQQARLDTDPWIDELARALGDTVITTTHECLDRHLAIAVERRTPYHAQRCGAALRRLGFVRYRMRQETLAKLGYTTTAKQEWVFVKGEINYAT